MMLLQGARELAFNVSAVPEAHKTAGQSFMGSSGSILQVGANITALLGFWTILRQVLPVEYLGRMKKWVQPYFDRFDYFAYYDIPEYISHTPNELFGAVQEHLSGLTAKTAYKASLVRFHGASKISYAMSASDEYTMETFQGVSVWWRLGYFSPTVRRSTDTLTQDECRFTLKIHKKHKAQILDAYIEHIVKNARATKQENRQRQLYTNSTASWRLWTSIPFNHPSNFATLALDPAQKQSILDDLDSFVRAEDFYNRVGRAWKRGYLLYGPPGTGKSSLICAMANYLHYDVYDLELTAVKDNTELRKLLLQTTPKSIIVIEDIDCTIKLPNRAKSSKPEEEHDKKTVKPAKVKEEQGVTLSGLLNFTDGIWSCCGSERLIVFTTNHISKLDPALLRTGRMDMKIHLSYCTFTSFKVLAKNYLDLDNHWLYPKVEAAMEGSHMTPADVSELLINCNHVQQALENLIAALHTNKLQPIPTDKEEEAVEDAAPSSEKNKDDDTGSKTDEHLKAA